MIIAKVLSDRDDDTFYTIDVDSRGMFSCTCPHCTYRHVVCKHIAKTKAVLLDGAKISEVFLAESF